MCPDRDILPTTRTGIRIVGPSVEITSNGMLRLPRGRGPRAAGVSTTTGNDDAPGAPLFHALVGNGVNVCYVPLPCERHHYRARENRLHTAAETLESLDRTIGPDA